jgi:hypothetical protein
MMKEAYATWGAKREFEHILKNGHTSPDALRRVLDAISRRVRERGFAVVPTSFDADDQSLQAFPQKRDASWLVGETMFKHHGSRGVMLRTPIFWQFGLPVYRACRRVGIPIFVNEPENVPVGAMSLLRGGIDTVVTESMHASILSSYLAEKHLPLPVLWFLIHRALSSEWETPGAFIDSRCAVAQEVHLFPGVPILVQCTLLSGEKSPSFHVANGCDIELGPTCHVSMTSTALPLYRYVLPLGLRASGTCECGSDRIERI